MGNDPLDELKENFRNRSIGWPTNQWDYTEWDEWLDDVKSWEKRNYVVQIPYDEWTKESS